MAALRPIVRDPLAGERATFEETARLTHKGKHMPQQRLASNALGNALAGFKAASKTSIRGGTFAPRATSGML